MVIRCPPGSESTARNAPSVEGAFQSVPEEMVVEFLGARERVHAEPFVLELALFWSE